MSTRELQQAFQAVRQGLTEGTTGSGLTVRVAIVELWCGFEPDEQGRVRPVVRTSETPQDDASHRLQLAVTLPDDSRNGAASNGR